MAWSHLFAPPTKTPVDESAYKGTAHLKLVGFSTFGGWAGANQKAPARISPTITQVERSVWHDVPR